MVWTAIESIATAFLSITVFVAFWQIRQANRSTNAEIAVEIFRELRDAGALKATRSIYHLVPEDFAHFTREQEEKIDYLTDRFNLLGGLVGRKVIDKRLAIAAYGGPAILRCWYQLARYIRKEQRTRQYYIEDYEDLTYVTWKQFKRKRIRVGFTNHDTWDTIPDLVQTFDEWDKDPQLKRLCPRKHGRIERERKRKAAA